MPKTSDISIKVHLDENNVPERMEWRADDAPGSELKDAQGMLLSLWDSKEQNALRIDIWTKDMRVDEMNFFFFQTIMTMADTYENATQNVELSRKMRGFGEYFAEKAEVFKDGGHSHKHGNHDHKH